MLTIWRCWLCYDDNDDDEEEEEEDEEEDEYKKRFFKFAENFRLG